MMVHFFLCRVKGCMNMNSKGGLCRACLKQSKDGENHG